MLALFVCLMGAALGLGTASSWVTSGSIAFAHGGWDEVGRLKEHELHASLPSFLRPGTRAYLIARVAYTGLAGGAVVLGAFLGVRFWRFLFVVKLGWMRDEDVKKFGDDPDARLIVSGWRWALEREALRKRRLAGAGAVPPPPTDLRKSPRDELAKLDAERSRELSTADDTEARAPSGAARLSSSP